MSPVLNALRLLITVATARAFYMHPAFDTETVPGHNNTLESNAARNTSDASAAPGTSTAVFDFRNHTALYADSMQPAEARSTNSAVMEDSRAAGTDSDGGSGSGTSVGPRDVWAPEIITPDAKTVWTVGETVTVKWDTSGRPKHVTNDEGRLVLGHLEDGDDTNEHLDNKHPLAEGFNLTQGHIKITVPHVDPSNHYIVVLIGDSGNRSPQFTIMQ